MGFYRAYVLPQLLGFSERVASMERVRQRTVEYATGHVLEVGIGLGATLPFYHHDITSLTTIDPDAGFNARLRRRLRHLPFPVDVREGRGEALPVKDCTFDCVVTSFALCCVVDLERVVEEIARVLKPGGRLFFAEPGPSREEAVLKWQRRVARLQRFFIDGCRTDREVDTVLVATGFDLKRLDVTYLDGLPKALACVYEGMAVKPV
ncbi:MAG: class I SAM-dependent methyltransferase [Gammaproteobacteria bacterium]